MRINKLELTKEELSPLGLIEFNSSKLNSVIALVGKNGSGKSRYLRAIEMNLLQTDFKDVLNGKIEFLPDKILSDARSIEDLTKTFDLVDEIQQLQASLNKDPKNQTIPQDIHRLNKKIKKLPPQLAPNPHNTTLLKNTNSAIQKEIKKRLKIVNSSDIRALKQNIDSKNPNPSFQDALEASTENINDNELSIINQSALTYLRRLYISPN